MWLVRATLRGIGPLDDLTLQLGSDPAPASERAPASGSPAEDAPLAPAPRATTLLFGADGTGKTTILTALASTRPGNALPPLPSPGANREPRPAGSPPPSVSTEWHLGADDPARPHPLVVASPTATFGDETPEAAAARRREQALFDRRAQQDGGFVFVSFSGARWFSRTANMLTTPERTTLRYDVRQPGASFDDPTRADLARETKQILSYATIAAALDAGKVDGFPRLEAALREAVDIVLEPFGLTYGGVSPATLEPRWRDGSRIVPFDAIPRAARHLVAFVTLPLRALFAAYPDDGLAREREGVVAIDDVDADQSPATLRTIVPLLERALPNVQWILTTSSAELALACDSASVIALRQTSPGRIETAGGTLH